MNIKTYIIIGISLVSFDSGISQSEGYKKPNVKFGIYSFVPKHGRHDIATGYKINIKKDSTFEYSMGFFDGVLEHTTGNWRIEDKQIILTSIKDTTPPLYFTLLMSSKYVIFVDKKFKIKGNKLISQETQSIKYHLLKKELP